MPPSLTDTLHEWRDFYLLVGTASATLVGLMFVAASIGASLFNEKYVGPLRAFITPTVVHFASPLFASIILTMPNHNWVSLGAFLGLGGLAGLLYCGRVLALIMQRFASTLDWEDRTFYALAPALGYLLLLAAGGAELAEQPPAAAKLIAAAILILLAAGLRNAWDMMVWLSVRSPSSPNQNPDPGTDP
ncbi:MAG: hypothetical protein JO107_10995 [Hyphomicrobiales bacterium]|nr:hypothetical protein [Hyphomicrobiales bacterium]MBV8663619.1 hypothetical protein [Hyphomicrobiales bacterium]